MAEACRSHNRIPPPERASILGFEYFRTELERRRRIQSSQVRKADYDDVRLADTLQELNLRRRRAQIAARKALSTMDGGITRLPFHDPGLTPRR
jgi:hypothetical protein